MDLSPSAGPPEGEITMRKKAYDPAGLAPAAPRYSQVVRVTTKSLIFIAGQTAVDSQGKLVGKGNIEAQAEQVYKNLQTALKAEGATFDNVVKLNTYVTDMKSRPILHRIRSKYIRKAPPASTLVGVTALADPDYLLEVEAIAAIG